MSQIGHAVEFNSLGDILLYIQENETVRICDVMHFTSLL